MSGVTLETAQREAPRMVTANRLRWASRAAVLLVCCVLLLTSTETRWPVLVPSLSPLVMLAAVLTTRTMYWFGWLAVVVLIVVARRHRWFCRWLCPTGFCADKATWAGRRLGRPRAHWPAIGQWIALITLAGACIGYPLLLWLDPMALLSAAFIAPYATRGVTALWYGSGLALVLLVSLLWPNVWCARLCPLGGTQDAVHGVGNLLRSALRVRRRSESSENTLRGGLRRRTVLGGIVGIVWAAATCKLRGNSVGPMRPPGAVDETLFTGLCIRCGNCSRACPTQIITHTAGQHGMAGLLTPQVVFREDYCLETCNRCTIVCPTGALRPVPLEEKLQAIMGVPVVDMDLCLLGEDRECSICRNHCPYNAIRFVFSEVDYTLTPQVDLRRCPGCGACQAACPTAPQKAIVVRPLTIH